MVFFGDVDADDTKLGGEFWRPMTVGCYPNRAQAEAVIAGDVASPWHEELDFCMLYEGLPGGDLRFIRSTVKGDRSGVRLTEDVARAAT